MTATFVHIITDIKHHDFNYFMLLLSFYYFVVHLTFVPVNDEHQHALTSRKEVFNIAYNGIRMLLRRKVFLVFLFVRLISCRVFITSRSDYKRRFFILHCFFV